MTSRSSFPLYGEASVEAGASLRVRAELDAEACPASGIRALSYSFVLMCFAGEVSLTANEARFILGSEGYRDLQTAALDEARPTGPEPGEESPPEPHV